MGDLRGNAPAWSAVHDRFPRPLTKAFYSVISGKKFSNVHKMKGRKCIIDSFLLAKVERSFNFVLLAK